MKGIIHMFLDYVAKAILGFVFIGVVGLVVTVLIKIPIFAVIFVMGGLVIWAGLRLGYFD